MLAEELQARGYTVIEAADTDEALTLFSGDNSIDLLLTDVKMPGTLDGAELA
jgi:CheY-like chemotaxis protein